MKIALDATPLTESTGGVSRYTAELSCALASSFPEDEYWLLSDQRFEPPSSTFANLKTGSGPRSSRERRWWLWGLQSEISRRGIGVFHGTDFAVPYLPIRPSVLTLHDLSPWLDESWHASAERVRTRTPLLLKLGLATLIVTPSEAIRRESMERFRIPADRILSVPHAASSRFRRVATSPEPVPYILYVGTLEPRKNIGLLLNVWRELRKKRAVRLVLAGRRRDDFPEIQPEDGLELLGEVPDEKLPGLYSGCAVCVYPSFYEGFGLPVLEAMQCGAAVVTSKDPAIVETSGGAALSLDVCDTRSWAEAINGLLDFPERREELRAKALARAALFSWEATARRTHEVYDEARRRFRKRSLAFDQRSAP